MTQIGVVAIGRNEGERLLRCLASATGEGRVLVYVDSGSSDGSVASARERGAHVVELSREAPFTAARARNAGLERLLEVAPDTEWVQFVDGDCEIVPEWWSAIARWLPGDPIVAALCGRRRERSPAASIYNRLCDLEWNTPVGRVGACGGDALMRVAALRAVGGFRAELIAGEEPELCFRLRAAGFAIERIGAEMTLHDAAMTSFAQWWRRAVRAGHAYAECFALHGHSAERFRARELRSILFWGGALPVLALASAWLTHGLSLVALIALDEVLWLRVWSARRRLGDSGPDAAAYATFVVVGKWAQLVGAARYAWNRALGRRAGLIEYKAPA